MKRKELKLLLDKYNKVGLSVQELNNVLYSNVGSYVLKELSDRNELLKIIDITVNDVNITLEEQNIKIKKILTEYWEKIAE